MYNYAIPCFAHCKMKHCMCMHLHGERQVYIYYRVHEGGNNITFVGMTMIK